MWALGLLAFEILSGQPVFQDDISDEAIGAMLAGCAVACSAYWTDDTTCLLCCMDS